MENILIEKIEVDPNQPRKVFSEADLDEMADPEKFMLVAGERRYRGAIRAELAGLNAIVKKKMHLSK